MMKSKFILLYFEKFDLELQCTFEKNAHCLLFRKQTYTVQSNSYFLIVRRKEQLAWTLVIFPGTYSMFSSYVSER